MKVGLGPSRQEVRPASGHDTVCQNRTLHSCLFIKFLVPFGGTLEIELLRKDPDKSVFIALIHGRRIGHTTTVAHQQKRHLQFRLSGKTEPRSV